MAPHPDDRTPCRRRRQPIWSCEVSSFPWTYDEQETCLLLEGDVTVTPDGGEPVRKHDRFG